MKFSTALVHPLPSSCAKPGGVALQVHAHLRRVSEIFVTIVLSVLMREWTQLRRGWGVVFHDFYFHEFYCDLNKSASWCLSSFIIYGLLG